MSKPIIGVTAFRTDSGRGYPYLSVTEAYANAVQAAGAVPLLIPLGLDADDLQDVRKILDGILFTGGGDIDPAIYNGEPHLTVHEIDHDRDALELQLARDVAEHGTPFLGICRGLQVLNVALGGTLYTHIMDQLPGSIKHDYWATHPRLFLAHPVRVEEGTPLAGIAGEPIIQVNSLHHQGVRDLAPGLTPMAYAPDGLIEAFELDAHPFGLAVQWHPEWLSQPHAPRLFEAFVRAAANGHA